MIWAPRSSRVVPLILAALLALPSSGFAQQQQAPKPRPEAKPAAKPAEQKPAAKPAPQAQKPPQPAAPNAQTPGGEQPSLIEKFVGWGAYKAAPGGRKVCFALARPTSSQIKPEGRKRDPANLFVSTRPADGVKDEVSVIIGYPFKDKSTATAEIGSAKFSLYTDKDGAWINAPEEARLIAAMRRGSDLVVKGVSRSGAETTDTFSLKGFSEALDRVAQECSE